MEPPVKVNFIEQNQSGFYLLEYNIIQGIVTNTIQTEIYNIQTIINFDVMKWV